MSILVNKASKVVVQGITGTEGTFHTNQMVDYGTNVVAGVTPGKGGSTATDHKIPVFNSVEDARNKKDANRAYKYYLRVINSFPEYMTNNLKNNYK